MEALTVDLWTFDVGVDAATPEDYAAEMTRRLRESWASGADVVLFPEYAWMGLERFVSGADKVGGVAAQFWKGWWPTVYSSLLCEGKAAVLGTVPWRRPDGRFCNRAPIVSDGKVFYQDKLNLTPWESMLGAGDALHVWTLRGVTFAVVVCLDIEVPELAAALRGRGVDCLLVPSATENALGVERVGRCASARAVELCCFVGVSQLVGRTDSQLVDENVGRLAWFTPSQSPFLHTVREQSSPLHEAGFHVLRCSLDGVALARARADRSETNPALLTSASVCFEIAPV